MSLKNKKKFVIAETPENRLVDRWEQQVFFVTRKYPNAKTKIAAIIKSETKRGGEFQPTEEALEKITELYTELQGSGSSPLSLR